MGHASITTTEWYDNQTLANLQVATARLERGLAFRAVSVDEVGREMEAMAGPESRPYQTAAGRRPKAAGDPPEPDSVRERRTEFKILSRSGLLQSKPAVPNRHAEAVLNT